MKKLLSRTLKVTLAVIFSLLLILFFLPIVFPGAVVDRVKTWANSSLDGELNFTKVRLSFFNHFPSLTATLYDASLKGSAPFKQDTLVAADEIALGINIASLFGGRIDIDKIFVSNALLNVLVNEKGEANYNVYVSKKSNTKKTNDTTGTALRLEKINIEDTRFIYNDRSIGMLIDAKGFNYKGSGDLSKDIFDLHSRARIDSLNFTIGNEPYLMHKKVNANLVTKINTNSLAFIFERNRLRINRLPVNFSGKLDFLQTGYDMDFTVSSKKSDLEDVVSSLPPQYLKWLEETKVSGTADLLLTLKGKYIASTNTSPDLACDISIQDGYINHRNAPVAASNLLLDLHLKMPSLNADSLDLRLDTINCNVGKDFVKGRLAVKGLNRPFIAANIYTQMDLQQLDRSLGLSGIEMSGKLVSHIQANGNLDAEANKFPVATATIDLQNAQIKTSYYPNPIEKINVKANISDPTGSFKDLKVHILPISFYFEKQPFFVQASLNNFENIVYDIKAKGQLDVARIYKVFSQEGLKLDGFISADLSLKGNQSDAVNGQYDKLSNSGTLTLKNIRTYSKYFPHAFVIKDGLFTFNQNKVAFKNFDAGYAASDFKLNGQFENIIDYIFSSSAILKGDFDVNSNFINVNEFLSGQASATDTTATSPSGVIVVPPAYNLSLTAKAGRVLFNDLMLQDVHGQLVIDTGALSMKETGFSMIGCKVMMNAKYKSAGPSKARFEYAIKASDFDVKRAYDSVKIFRDLASAAAYAQGIISVDYNLKGVLNGSMSPVYPSLEGGGSLTLKDVKVKGYKLFNVISRQAAKDSLNDPSMRKVTIKSTIKNNIITIERFRFKVFGFRPRIEGQTSFDGQLNLKMRLGLPPLGIIGIPIKVTGTQDEPIVKLGRKTEDLKETEYQDEQ
jgi:AsmA protein